MSKYWYTRFSIVFAFLIFGISNIDAKLVTNPDVQQEEIVSAKKSKLSLKEKIALRKVGRLQKQAKTSPKSVAGQSGFFSKIFLGIILIVLGALVIVGSVFTISLGGILLGIAGIVIGALVILFSTLGIFFD
jgi:hypothetical protein